jgi:hypothetical protein
VVYVVVWLGALLFLLIKGSLMNWMKLNNLDVDLVPIMTAYLITCNGKIGAGVFAFFQGIFVDMFSAGLLGLFGLIYLVVFLGIYLGGRFFDPHSPRGLVILVALAILLKGSLFVVLLDAFSLEMLTSSSTFLSMAASALCTGLIAPFLFYVLDQTMKSLVKDTQEAI